MSDVLQRPSQNGGLVVRDGPRSSAEAILTPDNSLTCSLCQTHLKNARVLPGCLHSFCFHCLETHAQERRSFPCPTCQTIIDLGETCSVEALPLNPYYNIMMDSGGSQDSEFSSHRRHNGVRPEQPPQVQKVKSGPINGSPVKPTAPPGWAPSQDLMSDPAWRSNPESIWKSPFTLGSQLAISSADGATRCNAGDNGWQPLGGLASPSWSAVIGSPRVDRETSKTNGVKMSEARVCSSCEEKHLASSHCKNCDEDLCQDCVVAHLRVKLTRDHVITRYPESRAMLLVATQHLSLDSPSKGGSIVPPAAPNLLSTVQNLDVLRVYADAVEKAKADSERFILKTKQGLGQIEEARQNVRDMEARVNVRYNTVLQEIKAITQRYIATVREREQLLITRLDNIRQVKAKTLEKQMQSLVLCANQLQVVSEKLSSCSGNGREMALIDTCNKAMESLREIHGKCGSLNVNEDDIVEFIPPDPTLLLTLAEVGYVSGSGFAPATLAEGDGLKKGILGKDARFIVAVKDQLNEKRLAGNDPVKVSIASPDGRQVRTSIFDGQNGTYRVVWKPNVEGEHIVSVTIKDIDIHGSPFKAMVRSGRNYNNVGKQLFEFGSEGEMDGQLCRPWGICCSKEGYILVANRSNNRIEVYGRDGKFHHKFGATGKLNGQFDRPASVCCDSMNRAIVSDKDNHRVQIFTVEGEYLMAFGERGSKTGQFNYPWDVACNSKDHILVSDTRNHRVQLFSPNGEFLTKYGFEGAMWKHFDSPRGVCFTASDQAVVTDFNNHRLLVVKPDFQTAQFLGKEGIDDGMFTRPNGVAVDEEGHIIVADSRNDRIQIFSSSGVFITKFGSKGTGPGEFDRPSGICISPEGHLIVVDFGNNRVQVF